MKTLSFLLVFLLTTIVLKAQTALENIWLPNDDVRQITRGDGKIFMSGDFDWFGPEYNSGVAIFDNQLNHDNSYPLANQGARSSVSDGAGGWYFAMYSGVTHIKADKTVEDLPFLFEGGGYPINTLEKIGNVLYVGGNFTTINGATSRKYAAAIDLSTNTLTTWNPNPNNYVYVLKAAGSIVYVGGGFTTIGGQTRSKIAAIDGTTGLASSWNPLVSATAGQYVYSIAVGPSTVYFGGSFTNVASASPTRRNFAAVNTTTGAVTTFNPRPDNNIKTILLDGNTLYVAGDFTNIAGVSKTELVALNVTTGLLTSFATTFNSGLYANNDVYALAIDGQKLFIGGEFLTINGVERARLAVVDKTTGALEPMADRAIGGYIFTISVSGGKLFAAGNLRGLSGITNSARWIALDEETGQGTNWKPVMPSPPSDGYVENTSFHYYNNRVFFWQHYYFPGDSYYGSKLGALTSTDGATIPTWTVNVNDISAWAFTEDALYIAGNFSTVNGVARNGFAAVDLVTGAVLPWTVNHTLNLSGADEINSMIVHNDVVYVGGEFTFTNNGVTRKNLAAWSAVSGSINSWAPQVEVGLYDNVKVGTVHSGKVYLIGNVMLRADATTGEIDEDWQPLSTDDYASVESVAIQGGSVYIAGGFSPGLLRADINTGSISGWQPELDDVYDSEGQVAALAVSGTKLFVGGNFSYGRGYFFGIYVLPVPTNNQPPQILATTTAVPIEGVVTIDLVPLISDEDNNLDLSSLLLINEFSEQGALASITESYELILDYGGVAFSGPDRVSISVCDYLSECTEQELTVEVTGDVMIYNAMSPNGDGINDLFVIKYVDLFPETQANKVTIFNRWGDSVFEISDYNNIDRVFVGQNKNGKDLPSGTYFYKIEFAGKESKTGYLSLKR